MKKLSNKQAIESKQNTHLGIIMVLLVTAGIMILSAHFNKLNGQVTNNHLRYSIVKHDENKAFVLLDSNLFSIQDLNSVVDTIYYSNNSFLENSTLTNALSVMYFEGKTDSTVFYTSEEYIRKEGQWPGMDKFLYSTYGYKDKSSKYVLKSEPVKIIKEDVKGGWMLAIFAWVLILVGFFFSIRREVKNLFRRKEVVAIQKNEPAVREASKDLFGGITGVLWVYVAVLIGYNSMFGYETVTKLYAITFIVIITTNVLQRLWTAVVINSLRNSQK